MVEGFAEWVAFRVAMKYGRLEVARGMKNPAMGHYYTGLMKYLALEKKVGARGVLEHAKTQTKI